MDISRAIAFRNQFIKDHPEHTAEVLDMFELMQDEIRNGESPDNEISLFINCKFVIILSGISWVFFLFLSYLL